MSWSINSPRLSSPAPALIGGEGRNHLDAPIASADKEVVQQDNDCHNEKEMN